MWDGHEVPVTVRNALLVPIASATPPARSGIMEQLF